MMPAVPGKPEGGRFARSNTVGKQKRMFLLRRLWKYLGRKKLLVFLALALSALSSILGLYAPKISADAINNIELGPGKVDLPFVVQCAVEMLVLYVLSAVFSYLLSMVVIRLSRAVAGQMRKDVFDNLMRLPIGFFDRYQTGDLISVITYDIDTVNQSISSDLLQILQTVISVVVSFVMMALIAPELLVIFLFTVPAMVLFTKYITTRVRPLFRRRSASLGLLNGYIEEMINGQKTTKAYGREQEVLQAFQQKNQAAVDAYTKAEANGTIVGPTVNLINNISLALVCTLGALFYLQGGIRLGDLAGFIQYSRRFSGPISEVANIIGELQSAFAAAERVFQLIDAEPEPDDAPDAIELKNVKGEVNIDHVTFGYDPHKPIIKDFSLHVSPGSLVAIVGPTGAGKTTLINLLMRFYDVDAGSISVDGIPIRQITRDSLRAAYSMVLQDTWLFHGTVFENIAYGKTDATMEEVERAARAAKIHNMITALPNGYDTMLTDNGSNLSKGQKQLITIARAMLLQSPMLILDEATSNVDTDTERRIQEAIRVLMRGKTCFVVAHRLSTIQNADVILVIHNGEVVEQGTHQALMAQNGFYAKLYYAQFETY